MTLAYDAFGADDGKAVWVLHGIMGSKKNWRSFARRAASRMPGHRWVTVDLPGHGDSSADGYDPSLEGCVRALTVLAKDLGQGPDVLVGHSFGGKVAMMAGPTLGSDAVVNIDAPPGAVALEAILAGEIGRVLRAVDAHPEPFNSFDEVVAHVVASGLSRAIGQWLTTSMVRKDGRLEWGVDVAHVTRLMASYASWDAWPLLEAPPMHLTLIRGGKSDRWTPEDLAKLSSLPSDGARVRVIEGAGHWVHAEAPEALWQVIEAGPLRRS